MTIRRGGSIVGASITKAAAAVSNGLFTVSLDFGGVFDGNARWLEIAVGTNGGTGIETLTPRQPLTPAPYAIYAPNAGTAAAVATGSVGTAELEFDAVVSSRIQDGTITTDDLNPSVLWNTFWRMGGNGGTDGATNFVGTTDFQPLEFRVNGERALRLEPNVYSPNVIGGYAENIVSNGFYAAVIAGGGRSGGPNRAGGNFAAVLGGANNTAAGLCSAVGGGVNNLAQGNTATIAGGSNNRIQASSDYGTIGGGRDNTVSSYEAIVAGGRANTASGGNSAVGGGYANSAGGAYAAVPGGAFNVADGICSSAAGYRAKATHLGAFVWADSTDADFGSNANDQFLVRAGGGARFQGAGNWDVNNTEGDFRVGNDSYRFKIGIAYLGGGAGDVWMRAQGGTARLFLKTPGGTTIYSNEGQSSGVWLAAGGGSWTTLSDRNAKENFAPVSPAEVLDKVVSLPLQTWNYKSQDASIRHMGPVAQDFRAAFEVGESDSGITSVDADGVALAAIQGLNEKVERGKQKAESRMEELEQSLQQTDTEVTELKRRLAELERLVSHRTGDAQ